MKLTDELFNDVIVYRISELGAMGPNGSLTILKKNGETFEFDYLSDKTPWEEIKRCFPGINAVSYTHLDVYKRQVDKWVNKKVL